MTAPPTEGGFANNPSRGIASLYFKGKTLRFRTNPNEMWWSYSLNTHIEHTYGGRVVQILGTKIEDLVIKIECGNGGWAYLNQVVDFLRTMMMEQRKDGGTTGIFNYTTRNWRMKVYALSVPFQDSVTATTRELEIHFKVAEDLTGEISQLTLSSELARLRDGIGFDRNNREQAQYVIPYGSLSRLSPTIADTAGQTLGLVPQVQNSIIPGVALPPTP